MVEVKVLDGKKTYTIMVREKESILDVLIAKDNAISAVCGGTGRCGKCKIKVLSGYLPATTADRAYFKEEEWKAGMRLSCKAYPLEPLQIALQFREESSLEVLSDYDRDVRGMQVFSGAKRADKGTLDEDMREKVIPGDSGALGIAIDIGTTTIVVQLLNLATGKKFATHTTINHQRSYGADVISRIMAATQGKGEALQKRIRNDLAEGIRQVIEKADVEPERIAEVAIAGNTTMIHLLMGYDCKGLGEFPFTPVNIHQITDTYAEIMGDDFLKATVYILPGGSAFVGGDIVAGLYTCDVDIKKEYNLLIDLGTNGEIALGNQDKVMVTSTAAGPAFEGGNITFGVGSIEGAICGVTIDEQGSRVRTIADKAPVGICGTGVIEAISELIKAGLVDETGCLDEKYFDDGYPLAETVEGEQILLTQADIREVQLAKAAVRAGLETLFLRYGIRKEEVSNVFLAGSFGFQLDCEKAIRIGMIPECFAEKMKAVGNSSLGGAVKFLLSKETRERVSAIGNNVQEINLSADNDFNQLFVDAMFFEDI